MRGILSLGAIGLVTCTTAMISVPTDARAVAIDIINQRISDFPESIVSSPAVVDGNAIDVTEQAADSSTDLSGEQDGNVEDADAANSRHQLAESVSRRLGVDVSRGILDGGGDEILQDTSEESGSGSEQTSVAENGAAEGTVAASVQSGEAAAEGENSGTSLEADTVAETETAPASGNVSGNPSSGVDVDSIVQERLRGLVAENDAGDSSPSATESESTSGGDGGSAEVANSGAALQTEPVAETNTAAATGSSSAGINVDQMVRERIRGLVTDNEATPASEPTDSENSGSVSVGGAAESDGPSAATESGNPGGDPATVDANSDPALQAEPEAETNTAAAAGNSSAGINVDQMVRERLRGLVTDDEATTVSEPTDGENPGSDSVGGGAEGNNSSAATESGNPGGSDATAEGGNNDPTPETVAETNTAAEAGSSSAGINVDQMVRERLRGLVTDNEATTASEPTVGENPGSDSAQGAAEDSSSSAATESGNPGGQATSTEESTAGGNSASTGSDTAAAESTPSPTKSRVAMAAQLRRTIMGENDPSDADANNLKATELRSREVSAESEDQAVMRARQPVNGDPMVEIRPPEVPADMDEVSGLMPREPVQPSAIPSRASAPVDDRAVNTIPEPGTWILMILGFWITAWRLRRLNQGRLRPVTA